MNHGYQQAIRCLSADLETVLQRVPVEAQRDVTEIRMRVHKPLILHTGRSMYFIKEDGNLVPIQATGMVTVTPKQMEESFGRMCGYSVYSHQEEVAQGFLTVQGGHRAGVCGTAVLENGRVTHMKQISSINLRVAHQVQKASEPLLKALGSKPASLLIAGAPASGKTTILRDLCYKMCGGSLGRYYKAAVIDERHEIAAAAAGVPQYDLGVTCDVLDGFPKEQGILHAVRTLSPEFILCDELGGEKEVQAVQQAMYCGVSMIATVHCGSLHELSARPQLVSLLSQRAFEYVAFLKGRPALGEIASIYKAGDCIREMDRRNVHSSHHNHSGVYEIGGFHKTVI